MIYLFCGTDYDKNRKSAHTLITSLRNKKKDASYFFLERDSFKEETLEELLVAQTLFEQKYIVYGPLLFESENYAQFIEKHIKRFAEAPHIFVFMEGALPKKVLKKFETHAEKIITNRKKEEKKEEYNIFSLTDALGTRNKRVLWSELHKAFFAGATEEEVFNVLYWQVKNMFLVYDLDANDVKKAEALGIKSYPFRKARTFIKNYEKSELEEMVHNMVSMFTDSRTGKRELALSLEKLTLSL